MTYHDNYLPKLTLAVQIMLKIRLGELKRPILIHHPASVEVVTSPEWDRLTVLHGRALPLPEEIPEWFREQWQRNRPELNGGG